ncbi:MAG: T9SS type A sorting domain-containing protein [Bacteroidota bacterium]
MKNWNSLKVRRIGLLLLFLLIINEPIISQDYTPFDFESGIWITNYFEYEGPDNHYQYYSDGDTLINNKAYHKLFQYHLRWWYVLDTSFNYYGAIVNDTLNRQVELIKAGQLEPEVLYNFNLDIGDTIKEGIGEDINLVVTEIDSIQVCGRFHKRFVIIRDYGGWGDIAFTEGIGFSFGFVEPVVIFPFETTSELICYTETANTNCSECDLLLGQKNIESTYNITLFPNPAKNNIIIKSDIIIKLVEIYSITGFQVFDKAYNSNNINIDRDFTTGMYFIKLYLDNNETVIEEIFFE